MANKTAESGNFDGVKLYLITPPKIDATKFLPLLESVLATGCVSVLQLRLKNEDGSTLASTDLMPIAIKVKKICDKLETLLIINDDVEVAKAVDATGVHLGKGDVSVKKAREILAAGKIIGASCYDSKHLAFCAAEDGADYLAFGSFFPSNTKKITTIAKPELLQFFCENSALPIVAIGGINHHNCQDILRYKPDFIATSSAIWQYEKGPEQAVKDFIFAFQK